MSYNSIVSTRANLTLSPHDPCADLTTAFLAGLVLSGDAEAFIAPSLTLRQVSYFCRP